MCVAGRKEAEEGDGSVVYTRDIDSIHCIKIFHGSLQRVGAVFFDRGSRGGQGMWTHHPGIRDQEIHISHLLLDSRYGGE